MWSDSIGILVFVTQLLLIGCGAIFCLSGLDDFFVDVLYVIWRIRGCLGPGAWRGLISEEYLSSLPEQPIAIMIPAWHEADVIRSMLTNTIRTIAYTNYHIFVGHYPNDPATLSEIEKVSAEFPNVHPVVCGNPGPTCKADCLNWVYQTIRRYAGEHQMDFGIVLMEDCEDCVHPLCLKLLNAFIPDYDMVQLPVFPLETQWTHFTSGHYIDEFAECHGKDIPVRLRLTGAIPAAGVGCAFSWRALDTLRREHGNELFNTSSLTEDYEFGLRVGSLGLRSVFLAQLVPDVQARCGVWRRRDQADRWIAVRELFPSGVNAAVKQKSRWIVGIAMQGWKNIGWRGSLAMRYMLFRDRKAILTNQVSTLGYGIVLFVAGLWTYSWLVPDAYRYPPLVERGSWLWNLLLVNVFFLVNRLGWRFWSVRRIYGYRQAFLAIPRQIWANIINGMATNRALYLAARSVILRRKIAWDKTTHVLPATIAIAVRPRIGDVLLEQFAISLPSLKQAVERFNPDSGVRFGTFLAANGYITAQALRLALEQQEALTATPVEKEHSVLQAAG